MWRIRIQMFDIFLIIPDAVAVGVVPRLEVAGRAAGENR